MKILVDIRAARSKSANRESVLSAWKLINKVVLRINCRSVLKHISKRHANPAMNKI